MHQTMEGVQLMRKMLRMALCTLYLADITSECRSLTAPLRCQGTALHLVNVIGRESSPLCSDWPSGHKSGLRIL